MKSAALMAALALAIPLARAQTAPAADPVAALVEQAAAAAESLHEQTVNLASAVAVFQVDADQGSAARGERRAPGSALRQRRPAAGAKVLGGPDALSAKAC